MAKHRKTPDSIKDAPKHTPRWFVAHFGPNRATRRNRAAMAAWIKERKLKKGDRIPMNGSYRKRKGDDG